MNQETKRKLRPAVMAWVAAGYPNATEVAPESGQRFVFRTDDDRALKILPPLNDADRVRCQREVQFLYDTAVDGLPQVIRPLTDVTVGGQPMLYYEEHWIDAPNLWQYVASVGPGASLAISVLKRGATILSEIHANSVVHRDISPGNLLVDGSTVYVVDLGLAKYLDLDPLTRTDEKLKMTAPFASPEQLTGGSAYLGPATDVYSLGMVVIYAANGSLAFLESNEQIIWPDYLSRMGHQDLVDSTGVPDVVFDMISPLAFNRPTAASVAERI